MTGFESIIYIILGVSLVTSCVGDGTVGTRTDNLSSGFITVDGTIFRDQHQRELILNGINLIIKDPGRVYVCGINQEEFKQIRDWGFNVIRLGIIWDGLEPEPGVYNDSMFRCLDERITWAKENGLNVILDIKLSPDGSSFEMKFRDQNTGVILSIEPSENNLHRELIITF